jgi:hypothetical protein
MTSMPGTAKSAASADCRVRGKCTTATRAGRQLTLRPRHIHQAVTAARAEQDTKAWQRKCAVRVGVEGLVAQITYVAGIRAPATSACPKPPWNTTSPPSRSTSSGSTPGGPGTRLTTRTSHFQRLQYKLAA